MRSDHVWLACAVWCSIELWCAGQSGGGNWHTALAVAAMITVECWNPVVLRASDEDEPDDTEMEDPTGDALR